MPKVIILGSSNAVPSIDHENTHLVILGKERTILVDCVSNPIVRLEWPSPEKIYLQTAYVRIYPNESINTFQRWHRLILSPQAAVLK